MLDHECLPALVDFAAGQPDPFPTEDASIDTRQAQTASRRTAWFPTFDDPRINEDLVSVGYEESGIDAYLRSRKALAILLGEELEHLLDLPVLQDEVRPTDAAQDWIVSFD